MSKFKVMINRTSYQSKLLTVDAVDSEQAERKALDDSGNHVFDKTDFAKYEVDYIEEVTNEQHD